MTVGGHDRLTITWSPSAGADTHEVRYKRGTGNYGSGSTRTSGWTHTGLAADTEYTYQVRAVNVNGPSDWSSEASETTSSTSSTSGQLGTPSSLRAVDATDTDENPEVAGIKVTWNRVTNADGYDLLAWVSNGWQEVTLDTDAVDDREVTVVSDLVSGDIVANTEYFFVIRATAPPADMGDWSAPFQSRPTRGNRSRRWTWLPLREGSPSCGSRGPIRLTPVMLQQQGPEGYHLEWRREGSTTSWSRIDVKDGTTHSHTGLRAGTTYLYRVRSYNSGGMSDYTHPSTEKRTWASQLSTPSGLKVEDATTDGDNAEIITDDVHQVKVSWNKVTGATAYAIQKWNVPINDSPTWMVVDANGTEVEGTTTTDTSYTDTGVEEGRSYWYIVRSVNGDVMSPWSAPVSGMARADKPPFLALVVVPTGTNSVRISWAAHDDATGYELEWIKGGLTDFTEFTSQESKTLPASPAYYSHSGLTAGTRYSYRLRAVLPQDVQSAWQEDNIQVVTRPVAPGVSATAVDHNTMKVTWDMVRLEDAGVPITDYELERRKTGETTWIPVEQSELSGEEADCANKKCSAYDNGALPDNASATLDANTKYYYRVRVAKNDLANLPDGAVGDNDGSDLTSYWGYASQGTSAEPSSN